MRIFCWLPLMLLGGDVSLRSGPQVNQRPGPYSALVSVGPQRGTQHCFICEAGDKPTVIVFARQLTPALGRLIHQLDKSLQKNQAKDPRGWVTVLAEDQPTQDAKIVDWAKKNATGNVPIAVFEDLGGPPSYLLHRDAEVTVLFSAQQKVARNFVFRAGELKDGQVENLVKSMQGFLAK